MEHNLIIKVSIKLSFFGRNPMAEREIPKAIGEYEIIRSLGKGVMGEVFLGRKGNNITHAIKIINNRVAQKLDSAHRFEEEIIHENLMQYLAIRHEQEYQHYFVTDYLEVRPVSSRVIRRQRHGVILDMFIKLCEGLALMHSKGVLHGNIKSSNVLVRRDEDRFQPILSDIGIGYIYDSEYFKGTVFRASAPYMSPEYIAYITAPGAKPVLPESIIPASDLYSLAVALCEALTGKPLFDEEDMADLKSLVKAKQTKKFRLVAVNHPSASVDISKLNELVNRCLLFDSEERPQTVEEFVEGLQAARLRPAAA
jgi:serine/threonine protein kinase